MSVGGEDMWRYKDSRGAEDTVLKTDWSLGAFQHLALGGFDRSAGAFLFTIGMYLRLTNWRSE